MHKNLSASLGFHEEQAELPTLFGQVNRKLEEASRKSTHSGSSYFGETISRLMDIIVATLIIVIIAPLFVLLAFTIWANDRGAPIFTHRRIGRDGRTFPCLKFRTMVIDADQRLQHLLASDPVAAREWALDHKLRVDPRITRLGGFLRKTSLDELPQLANVIIGHMSLVGPRPIVQSEVNRYGRYFKHYCQVRPGITGLWQVSGRNDVSYRRRVALDTFYARRKSVKTDLMIIGRTLPAVLLTRGSY